MSLQNRNGEEKHGRKRDNSHVIIIINGWKNEHDNTRSSRDRDAIASSCLEKKT